jgi:hypothetical protein
MELTVTLIFLTVANENDKCSAKRILKTQDWLHISQISQIAFSANLIDVGPATRLKLIINYSAAPFAERQNKIKYIEGWRGRTSEGY